MCLDNPVGMLLFPCAHLVTCVNCTTALFECPVCRGSIKGTVSTDIHWLETRAVPFIFRVAPPNNAACRAACGWPQRSKGARLSTKGAGVGMGGCLLPQEGLGGFPPGKMLVFRMPGEWISGYQRGRRLKSNGRGYKQEILWLLLRWIMVVIVYSSIGNKF